MGFFPVCPGKTVYDIGSPLFRKVTIDVGNGRKFVIKARNVSPTNKYIRSANLNGKLLNNPWFSHSDLSEGGKLVLQMDKVPNKSWGTDQ
jgi:putative alpha-1,2-mannosidase